MLFKTKTVGEHEVVVLETTTGKTVYVPCLDEEAAHRMFAGEHELHFVESEQPGEPGEPETQPNTTPETK